MTHAARSKRRIAVVTVHGTGDTAVEPDGPKWFQKGSAFSQQLSHSLARHGVAIEIVPHLWSGANSAMARERSAKALTKKLKLLAKSYGDVHIIGHSHGGNIANDAAVMLDWPRKRRSTLASVTTVGTPFFRTHVTRGERFGAWVFLAIVVLSVLMASVGAVGSTSIIRPLTITNVLLLAFVVPLAWQGVWRIRRAARRPRSNSELCSIWHPNDEAIAFLQRMESLPIEPFRRWSLLSGYRTGAIVWGVRAVIAIPVVGALLIVAALVSGTAETALAHGGISLALLGLAGAPLVFAVVYLLYRFVVALALEFGLRESLNQIIGGSLKGIAFGRDGDNRICDVSPCSHYYNTRRIVLEGEVAQRMLAESADATRRLFDKYRGSLFSVGADTSNALNDLTQDTMTWESLIHTTYFIQPEIVDMIGDYIAESARVTR